MLTPDEHKATIQERNEHREEYRRELERHVEPIKTAARETDKSALELAQSGIKTMTLLNGSALIAIPAVVTLFGVDAKAVIQRLFIAGGFYVFGMITAVLSSVLGALALSHRSDRDYNLGEATRHNIHKFFYPKDNTENDFPAEAEQHNAKFVTYRRVAISAFALSLVGFICGSGIGALTILSSPLRPVNTAVAPPCKNGAQTCSPWERDWSNTALDPGSTVTNSGVVVVPKDTKP
jgi:hypothetical protein